MPDAVPSRLTPEKQGWIGLILALAIIGTWSVLHVYAVFFFHDPDWLGGFLLVAGLTWLSVGLFIVAHDAMPGSLLPRHRRFGNVIGATALLLYAGFSFFRLLPKHHLHHAHPGSDEDPDFAPDSPDQPVTWYIRFTRTYFGPRELLLMTIRVWAYYFIGASFFNILVFFALPAILSSFQLFYFGTYLPHHHYDHGHDDPAHQTHTTPHFADHHNARSNDYSYMISLLTCFHFGYHHEHHLKPGTPWWRLPQARKASAP